MSFRLTVLQNSQAKTITRINLQIYIKNLEPYPQQLKK